MCLNAVTRLQEDLLPGYYSIKRHFEFSEYFIPDRDHPSYSGNVQIYTSLGHSLFLAMTNDTCVKSSIDDFLNTTNNETEFPEITRVFKENFEMKLQEGSVLKYLNFRIFQSPVSFSVYQTDNIMELVNEWFPTGKFRKVDTPFRKYYSYGKELLAALQLTGHALYNV